MIFLSLCFHIVGCTSNINAKKNYLNSTSCLESFDKDNLIKSLELCNNLIENFPDNPSLLNDRAMIYMLKGKSSYACVDIKKAFNLIKMQKKEIEPLIKYQITIRNDSCAKK